uniref:Uncharacterized protein n=1 Tax=Arundo donax TaxID=35708 RepID=A0A0A9H1L9_ARUDO
MANSTLVAYNKQAHTSFFFFPSFPPPLSPAALLVLK